jgi:hypothetical protein
MPIVAIVDGIKITFYYDEHPPMHFHAKFAENEAMIDIETLKPLKGRLPRPQLRKVIAWARPRQELLRKAWSICQGDGNLGKIP